MPRASLAQFEDLRKAIIATNWAEKLKAEVLRLSTQSKRHTLTRAATGYVST